MANGSESYFRINIPDISLFRNKHSGEALVLSRSYVLILSLDLDRVGLIP